MRHMTNRRTILGITAAAVVLAGCGSSDENHAGSNVQTEGEADPEAAEEAAADKPDEPEGSGEEQDEEAATDGAGQWSVPTVAYGEAGDVPTDSGAQGSWSVTVQEPECDRYLEVGEFSIMDDPEPQGQWCTTEISATNEGDQPLDFWMDNDVAIADAQARTFTPDSDAVIEANDMLYTDTQVGQTFEVEVWFDLPAELAVDDLAGVAIARTWADDDELYVWSNRTSN